MQLTSKNIGSLVARIAREVVAQDRAAGAGGAVFTSTESVETRVVLSPAPGDTLMLSTDAPLVRDTVELVRVSDGHVYLPYQDFREDGLGGFESINIPEGTELTATWFQEPIEPVAIRFLDEGAALPGYPDVDFRGSLVHVYPDAATESLIVQIDQDPPDGPYLATLLNDFEDYAADADAGPLTYYSRAGRVYLEGVVAPGATSPLTSGTAITTLPADETPAYRKRFLAAASSGPLLLSVETNGELRLAQDATGATWIALDSLSYRSSVASGLYPHDLLYPYDTLYPY